MSARGAAALTRHGGVRRLRAVTPPRRARPPRARLLPPRLHSVVSREWAAERPSRTRLKDDPGSMYKFYCAIVEVRQREGRAVIRFNDSLTITNIGLIKLL